MVLWFIALAEACAKHLRISITDTCRVMRPVKLGGASPVSGPSLG
jgi:hypothetical protein